MSRVHKNIVGCVVAVLVSTVWSACAGEIVESSENGAAAFGAEVHGQELVFGHAKSLSSDTGQRHRLAASRPDGLVTILSPPGRRSTSPTPINHLK